MQVRITQIDGKLPTLQPVCVAETQGGNTRMSGTAYMREFSMPSAETFSMPPVSRILRKWLRECSVIVDPFSRNSTVATITNDLDPNTRALHHMKAEEFVESLDCHADAVLFDPPYSPRQIAECYAGVGLKCSTEDTQNARLYRTVRDGLDRVLGEGGIAISCGWNSAGFGVRRGYELLEVLIVHHGAAHNDTIVTVERKLRISQQELSFRGQGLRREDD